MKNTQKVAIATLAAACLVGGVVGLTACDNEPAVVSKISLGSNYIGTVTTEDTTFDVEGTVDTEYKLTATVGGETCNDILMTINGVPSNGWAIFTYAEDTTVTFKTVSDDVAKVTVVMEKYEPEGPGPSVTTYDLAEGSPATVTDLKSGDNFSIKFNTQTGKTYTVTVSDENVKFANLTGGENESGPKSFNGTEFVDYDNVATILMTAEANVSTVTISLSVKDTEDVGGETPVVVVAPEITVGSTVNFDLDDENAVNWFVYYKVVITDGGEYSITTNVGENTLVLCVGTDADAEYGGVKGEIYAENGYYYLAADTTYYIGLTSGNLDFSNFTGSFVVAAKPAD